MFRGPLGVLLVQHHGEQDPTLAALGREQEAIAVVLPLGLDPLRRLRRGAAPL